jgi:hypothetical protein
LDDLLPVRKGGELAADTWIHPSGSVGGRAAATVPELESSKLTFDNDLARIHG